MLGHLAPGALLFGLFGVLVLAQTPATPLVSAPFPVGTISLPPDSPRWDLVEHAKPAATKP